MDQLAQKLVEIIDKIQSPGVDLAIASMRVDGVQTVVGGVIAGAVVLALVYLTRWLYSKLDDAKHDTEFIIVLGVLLAGLAALACAFCSITSLCDVWAWVSLFNPKLALAHQLVSGLHP